MGVTGCWYLIIAALLTLAVPARADCMASFNPGGGGPSINPLQGGGSPGNVTLNGCSGQGDTINITQLSAQNFDSRFAAIQNAITVNRNEARAGISMAMAAASMGTSGAAAGAGSGKVAAGLGVGDFQGTVSLSAGIAYAVNKRFILNGSFSAAPFNGQPSYGFMGGASLVLN